MTEEARASPVNDQANYDDPISVKTREYHRKVMDLASSPSNTSSLAWNCVQHILDQMWEGEAGNKDKDFPKATTKECQPKIVYACQVCGHMIHPGWNGTSLRVERSPSLKSKTLRRRQQRKRKKMARSNVRDAKDRNRPKRQHKTSQDEIDASSAYKEPSCVLLQDDPNLILDRHHLTLRCGQCRSTVRLKGLKPDKSKGTARPTKISFSSKDVGHKRRENSAAQLRKDEKGPAASNTDSIDFLQLPLAVKLSAKNSAPLTIPPGRKKKQKKKADPKKGNQLLGFLNSLND